MTYMRTPTTMSTKEVARQLTKRNASMSGVVVDAATISKMCKQGKLRAKKANGGWRIKEADAAKLWPHSFSATAGQEG